MNAEHTIQLPPGTSVYGGPHGLILDCSWRSARGVHIIRARISRALCAPQQRSALRALAREFRQLVEADRLAS